MLGLHSKPLVDGEWEAWRYGPVMRPVYFELNHYRGAPIPDPIPGETLKPSPQEQEILDVVYGYRSLGTFQLVGISHSRGGPWHRVWHNGSLPKKIPNEMMEGYFQDLSKRERGDE